VWLLSQYSAWAVVLLQQNEPLPVLRQMDGGYVVNDPSQAGRFKAVPTAAWLNDPDRRSRREWVSGSQALFGNWDTTLGALHLESIHHLQCAGSASAVPLNRWKFRSTCSSQVLTTPRHGRHPLSGRQSRVYDVTHRQRGKHVVFTGSNDGTANTTLAFNASSMEPTALFDTSNILRIDNLQVQTLDIPVVWATTAAAEPWTRPTTSYGDRRQPHQRIASIGIADGQTATSEPASANNGQMRRSSPTRAGWHLSLLAIAAAARVCGTSRRHGCTSAKLLAGGVRGNRREASAHRHCYVRTLSGLTLGEGPEKF
jgi:hypothetical protein